MGDCGFIYYCCMYHQWLINCCFHSDAGFDMHNGALLCHGNPRIITYCCSHGNLLIKCVFALQLYLISIISGHWCIVVTMAISSLYIDNRNSSGHGYLPFYIDNRLLFFVMVIYYIKVNNGWLLLHYCCFRIFVGSLHRYGQWALTLPWWSCLLNETFGIFLAVVNFLFNADNGYCCCHEDLRVCANNERLSLPWWSILSRRQWLAVVAAVIYYLTSSMDGRCECVRRPCWSLFGLLCHFGGLFIKVQNLLSDV